jgi:hypothetical protein
MPDYRYFCVTLKGEYLEGEYAGASDTHDLARVLWKRELFLIWCEELVPAANTPSPTRKIDPRRVARAELAEFWKNIWQSDNSPIVPGRMPRVSEYKRRAIYGVMIAAAVVGWFGNSAGSVIEAIRGRWRFHRVCVDMQRIVDASKEDYALHKAYAPQVMPGVLPPDFDKYLSDWPDPPCPGWVYGWDQWIGVPGTGDTVRVTLRDDHLYSVYFQCLSATGDCSPPIMWGHGVPISQAQKHILTCRENKPLGL